MHRITCFPPSTAILTTFSEKMNTGYSAVISKNADIKRVTLGWMPSNVSWQGRSIFVQLMHQIFRTVRLQGREADLGEICLTILQVFNDKEMVPLDLYCLFPHCIHTYPSICLT